MGRVGTVQGGEDKLTGEINGLDTHHPTELYTTEYYNGTTEYYNGTPEKLL